MKFLVKFVTLKNDLAIVSYNMRILKFVTERTHLNQKFIRSLNIDLQNTLNFVFKTFV